MPTNLKSLLGRSRSRNELKLREKGEENCCELSNDSGSGSSENGNGSSVGGQCRCGSNGGDGSSSYGGESTTTGMKRDASCKTLFFSCTTLHGVGDLAIGSNGSGSGSSSSSSSSSTAAASSSANEGSSSQSLSMRKSETVLALSSFTGAAESGGGSGLLTVGSVSSNSATASNLSTSAASNSSGSKVKVMKEKIFSTSSSTLNCLLHSSNRTTSKLFSGWKLSSNSNNTSSLSTNGGHGVVGNASPTTSSSSPSGNSQSNNCVNTASASVSVCQKSKSQLSISETSSAVGVSGAPLTPINRLRRNVSVNNTSSYCPNSLSNSSYSRSSSVTSFIWKEKEDHHQEEILCRLCLCGVGMDETVEILACSCRYCKDCVMAYVSFEIQEGAYDIACPDASCEKQGVLTLVEIENLVSTLLMDKHRKFRLYREVEKDGQLMWCPSPGCETVCRIQEAAAAIGADVKVRGGGSRSLPSINCTTCHKSFCAECKLSWHPETSCEAFRRKLVKQGKLSLDDEELFSMESIKKCPFCHVPIEKDSGCAQMMCKRCKHVFCWYCLASLDDDFLLRHYDKGPCKNKLGHSRASVVWHRAQVIGIFAGFGVLVLLASPLLILAAPCLLCCRCRYCANKLDPDESPVPV